MYSLKRICDKLTNGISKRALVLGLALVMALSGIAGGTLAFLHGTQEAKNTFTYGDISITLQETDTGLDQDDDLNTNQYMMNPGQPITKDPTVTVDAFSMDCWLFVEIQESENFADFMAYAVADGWLPLEGQPFVFYRPVDYATDAQAFPVLQDNTVTLLDSVTLDALAALTEDTYPTLSFTAYAVQRDTSIPETATPESAFALLQGESLITVQ